MLSVESRPHPPASRLRFDKEARAAFAAVDVNRDGVITREEFRRYYVQHRGKVAIRSLRGSASLVDAASDAGVSYDSPERDIEVQIHAARAGASGSAGV